MFVNKNLALLVLIPWIGASVAQTGRVVRLTHGADESAGGGPAYIISAPSAIYCREKEGGGLSSLLDLDGVDWLGLHSEEGPGWKGEGRRDKGKYLDTVQTFSIGFVESTDYLQIDRAVRRVLD